MKKTTGTDRSITRNWRPQTRAVRAGTWRSEHGETSEALFLTSGYTYDDAATVAARFAGTAQGMTYSRLQNPTVAMLEERIAALEGAEACRRPEEHTSELESLMRNSYAGFCLKKKKANARSAAPHDQKRTN